MDDHIVIERGETLPVVRPADHPQPTTSPTGPRRLWVVIALIVLVAIGAWLLARHQRPAGPARQAAATVPVSVATLARGDIDITLDALGTVTSLATVTVVSQISGQLMRIAFTEGQDVNKGDLLAEIDSRPYELALAQAQGALERDQALLQNAELDLKRYQDLAKSNAIPRQQLDTQVSLVLQDKGNVISDQAQIETQQLNISYCHIVSPAETDHRDLSGRGRLPASDHQATARRSDPAGDGIRPQRFDPVERGRAEIARQPDQHQHRHAQSARAIRQ
jgi:multidrug efflux system membrane fusion protein